jgi:site-specific recombinase XerD
MRVTPGRTGAKAVGRIDKKGALTLIEQFNAHQLQRGLTRTTVDLRAGHLRRFDQWLNPGTLPDATAADIEAFLETRSWEDATRYVFLSHLHAYYRWAVRTGVTDLDPTEFVDRPKVRPGLPRPIPDDSLAYLLAQATGRMRTWLLLGAFEGLRCMEIAGLQRSDVIEADAYLRILGKGRKERVVPLHPLVLESLRILPMPRLGPLWRMNDGRSMTGSRVSQAINRWMREMSVDATAHQLRHWFGTRSYQACQDVLAVAGMMGHSNTATTSIYAQFSHKVARAAVLSLSVN